MSISCEERMHALLADLEAGVSGLELDVHEECIEEWSKDYAVCLVDIIEPEHPEFFDLDQAREKIVSITGARFGRTFTLGGAAMSRVALAYNQVLSVRRLGSGWALEIEAYRNKKEKKR